MTDRFDLQMEAIARVERKWTRMRRGIVRAARTMEEIAAEEKGWDYSKAAFPHDQETLDLVDKMVRFLRRLEG